MNQTSVNFYDIFISLNAGQGSLPFCLISKQQLIHTSIDDQ